MKFVLVYFIRCVYNTIDPKEALRELLLKKKSLIVFVTQERESMCKV